jgi:hypothetical protein
MTLAEGAGAPNVLVDARYRAIESVIPRVIPVSATLSCTGGEGRPKTPALHATASRPSAVHRQRARVRAWRAVPAGAHVPLSKPCRQHGLGRAAAAAQSVVMRHRTGACPTSACGHPAAAQPWRYLPRAHCNRHMQSACCSGRNHLRDQLREMEVRTASSGARAYRTTSVLQHHDAVGGGACDPQDAGSSCKLAQPPLQRGRSSWHGPGPANAAAGAETWLPAAATHLGARNSNAPIIVSIWQIGPA